MEKSQKIESVINTLLGLFSKKDRLVGIKDWDTFISCIVELQAVHSMLIAEEKVALEKNRTNEDGKL